MYSWIEIKCWTGGGGGGVGVVAVTGRDKKLINQDGLRWLDLYAEFCECRLIGKSNNW
jgi:hypothetical protein